MGAIQGLDTIPISIQRDFGPLLADLLPGWSGKGAYNFQPGAATQKAAAQLGVQMQNGSHPWINDAIKDLIRGTEFEQRLPGNPSLLDSQTKRLAALVNFMYEASSPGAIGDSSRTGGYVAWGSKADPNMLKAYGYRPSSAELRAGLNWTNILESDAGKAVLDLNPRIISVNGVNVLQFDGTINNGGFFSKAWDQIDTHTA